MNRVTREAGFLLIAGTLLTSAGIGSFHLSGASLASDNLEAAITILAGLLFFVGSYWYPKISKRDLIPFVLTLAIVLVYPNFIRSDLTFWAWVGACVTVFVLAVYMSFGPRLR